MLVVNEEEMEHRSCDRIIPAVNSSPVVSIQIGLKKPHMLRLSLVILS
jgi:hypothetical protein